MNIAKIGLGIVLGATTLFGQDPARQSFEVASIRPSGGAPPQGVAVGVHIDGAQFRATFMTLKDYTTMAYQLKIYQVFGPDWIQSDRFSIAATLPEGSLPAQIPNMMQTLLEERFQLKLHREKKEFPIYSLEVAKGGLRMTETPPETEKVDARAPQAFTGAGSDQGVSVNLGQGASFTFSNNKFEAKKLNMPALAGTLERFLDRPVVDMTNLQGRFDFAVDVTPEDYRTMLIRSAVVAGVSLPAPVLRVLDNATSPESLFQGLEKLGLKLEARKAPLDALIIDSALKTPTEN